MSANGSAQLWWLKQSRPARSAGVEPFDPDPEHGPDGQPGERHRDPVADGLADRVERPLLGVLPAPASIGHWLGPASSRAVVAGSSWSIRSRTADAASRAPGAGGTAAFGTRTTVIPAARPANTPFSKSSTTRQSAAATPSLAAVRR